MFNKFKLKIKFKYLLSLIIILFLLFIIFIYFSYNSKDRSSFNELNNIEDLKYNVYYPDVILIKGKIISNSKENEKIEIYYDKIYQYKDANYIKIINPRINIFRNNKKTYFIRSKEAYSNNIENVNIVNLKGDSLITDYNSNINISSDYLECNLEKNQIITDQMAIVKKDGFIIYSKGIFINDTYANFKSDVKIENKTGLFESKIVDEFVNLNGSCDNSIFYLQNKTIIMMGNSILFSNMLDLKGDRIDFYQLEYSDNNSEDNVKSSFSKRIVINNGYAKYVTKDKIQFYSIGSYIDYNEGNKKLYILKKGKGYYKDLNSVINFAGDQVTFQQDNDDKSHLIIFKGYLHQKKYDYKNRLNSQFYSKGEEIKLLKSNVYSYNCVNGYGYLQDISANNEVAFSGYNINYLEKDTSKITGNAYIFDFIGKIFVKGEQLFYFDYKKIVKSDKPFFVRQFKDNFFYSPENLLKGEKIDFEADFIKINKESFNIIINDIFALKGMMNTETSESIIEGNVDIIDYQNLIQIRSDTAKYSGKESQIYYAQGNLTIYQYQQIENILNKKYLSNIIQSEKATIYKKDDLAYFEGEPKIKNFKNNFFIISDLLEAHLNTKIYIFKDNIKLLINNAENKEIENQVYIIGQYAVFESEKKIIAFSGNSILVQKNIELKVSEIYVDFNKKTINFKGAKDSKFKIIKY